jgi:hypothetical protein
MTFEYMRKRNEPYLSTKMITFNEHCWPKLQKPLQSINPVCNRLKFYIFNWKRTPVSDVFISYSRLDKEFVGQLREALAREEQDVWVDWEDIPPSQSWWDEIQKGIARANNFVLVMSEHSMSSPICQLEIEHARQLKKRIIPVLHSDYDRDQCLSGINGRLAKKAEKTTREIWGQRQPYGSFDGTLRLWDAWGQFLTALEGHETTVYGALELSDGRLLSWSFDGTLRLWDAQGQFLTALEGHETTVYGALELSDGRLLSWSFDGTLRLWDKEQPDLVTYACSRLSHDFTDEQRKEFLIKDTEPTCPQFAIAAL